MANRRRETLKNFFQNGRLPNQEHFRDLIDSNLNMVDEGFKKSAENGFEIYTPVGEKAFISFFRDAGSGHEDQSIAGNSRIPTPLWKLTHGGNGEHLLFQAPRPGGAAKPRTVILLDRAGRVGINADRRSANAEPSEDYELDVLGRKRDYDGVIRSGGRQGWGPKGWRNSLSDAPVTDGRWHNITEDLQGCQAFEVMAGARDGAGNRVSLMHAIVVSTFNRRNPWWYWFLWRRMGIRYTYAYRGGRCDKLELRWHGDTDGNRNSQFKLQIRSKCNWEKTGGKAVDIKCYVTRLWFDDADTIRRGATDSDTDFSNDRGDQQKDPST
jgi:hypothetical protein